MQGWNQTRREPYHARPHHPYILCHFANFAHHKTFCTLASRHPIHKPHYTHTNTALHSRPCRRQPTCTMLLTQYILYYSICITQYTIIYYSICRAYYYYVTSNHPRKHKIYECTYRCSLVHYPTYLCHFQIAAYLPLLVTLVTLEAKWRRMVASQVVARECTLSVCAFVCVQESRRVLNNVHEVSMG